VAGDLAVGAPGTGTVHLFSGRDGEPSLTIESPPGASRFGSAIAAVGANILVGAPGSGDAPGKAFLFPANSGSPRLTLTNPLAAAGDQFGFAVATDGSRLLIGAPGAGAVYLFSFDTGELIRTFVRPTPRAGDRFGASIAVIGASLLVGAPSDGELAPGGGASYLFDLDGDLRGVLRKEGARPEGSLRHSRGGIRRQRAPSAPRRRRRAGRRRCGLSLLRRDARGGVPQAACRLRASVRPSQPRAPTSWSARRGARSGAGAVGRFDGASGAAPGHPRKPGPG